MSYILIAALLILIVFLLYAGAIFFPVFLVLLYNIPILYVIFLIAKGDLVKLKYHYEYFTALLIGIIVFVFTINFFLKLPFWPITSFLILVLLLARLEVIIGLKKTLNRSLVERPLKTEKRTGLKKNEHGWLKRIERFGYKKH